MTANITLNFSTGNSADAGYFTDYFDAFYPVPADDQMVYLAMLCDENEVVNTLKVFLTHKAAEAYCQFCRDEDQLFLDTNPGLEVKKQNYYVIPKPFIAM